MSTRRINLNQLTVLIILYLIGGTAIANVGKHSSQDIWVVILISSILGGGLLILYHRLSQLNEYKGLPEIFRACLGKGLGTWVIIIYASFFLLRIFLLATSLAEMAQLTLMYGESQKVILAVLLITVVYCSLYGINAIGRSAEIFFGVIILCLIPFFISVFSNGLFKYDNLIPIFAVGTIKIRQDIFRTFLFPFGELILFLMLFQFIPKKESHKILKRSCIALFIGTLIIVLIEVMNLALLGSDLVTNFKYPFYNAMQLATLRGLIDRLDPLAIIIIIISGYFKLVLYFYAGTITIQSLNKKFKYKWVLLIVALGIFFVAPYIEYDKTNFLVSTLPYKIMTFIELGIPILLWLISEVKNYQQTKKTQVI